MAQDSRKYEMTFNFRHWKKGDVIERYEYNRLPDELKHKAKLIVPVEEPKVEHAKVAEVVANVTAAKKARTDVADLT